MMPVSYPAGIVEEHKATRTAVGIFDVSHMGEVHFRGPGAAAAVQRLVHQRHRPPDRRPGAVHRGLPPRRRHRRRPDRLPAGRPTTSCWWSTPPTSRRTSPGSRTTWAAACEIHDASDETALIAFQGPQAAAALSPADGGAAGRPAAAFQLLPRRAAGRAARLHRPHRLHRRGRLRDLLRARRRARRCGTRWSRPPTATAASRSAWAPATPCAWRRGCPLYGNDLDETTTPLEAGLGWVVKLGGRRLHRQGGPGAAAARRACRASWSASSMQGRGIARHGYGIHCPSRRPPGGGGDLGRLRPHRGQEHRPGLRARRRWPSRASGWPSTAGVGWSRPRW